MTDIQYITLYALKKNSTYIENIIYKKRDIS